MKTEKEYLKDYPIGSKDYNKHSHSAIKKREAKKVIKVVEKTKEEIEREKKLDKFNTK